MKRRTFLSAGCASLLACSPFARAAETYPKGPVRMIVPYAAGGGADTITRIVAQGMGAYLKQSFIVENRPGAGGTIGADVVARSAPDGYTTLMAGNPELTITPWLQDKVNYSAARDFVPVVLVSQSPNVLVANPKSGYTSLSDVLDVARRTKDSISIATPGSGTPQHIAVEILRKETGLDLIHVPYKGAGPATIALLGGEVTLALVGAPPVLPHIAEKKLTALAITQPKRTPLLPEVPTVGEALGIMRDDDLVAWYGLLVPAGTPQDAVQQLEKAAFHVLEQPGMSEKFASLGTDLVAMRAQEFAARMKNESDRYQQLIRQLGLTA